MKVLLSLFGGAVQLQEQGGVVSFVWNASLGGGQASGWLKGQGSVSLNGNGDLALAEGWLNGKLPPSLQPLAVVIEGVANQAIQALE